MSQAIIAEAQRRLAKAGKNARMRLSCSDILALAGVEAAKPKPVAAPAPAPTPAPAPALTPDPEPVDDAIDYGAMGKAELVAEAKSRDLDGSGNKAELIERLQANDASDPDEQ